MPQGSSRGTRASGKLRWPPRPDRGKSASLWRAEEEGAVRLEEEPFGARHGADAGTQVDWGALSEPPRGAWLDGPRGLAPVCYTSPEFYALEMQRIFRKEWLCIGRADEVEQPGDYMSLDLLGEPLVVVRDATGEVRVLSRV